MRNYTETADKPRIQNKTQSVAKPVKKPVAKNNSKTKKKSGNKKQNNNKLALSISNGVVRLALDVILYICVILLTVSVCKYAYNFCYQVFGSASVTNESDAISMSITVNEGESTLDIAKRLEGYGLILDKYSFVAKSRIDKISIKPGTFVLSSDMDYDEILAVISDISQSKDEDELGDAIRDESEE